MNVSEDYMEATVEILEILKLMNEDDVKKIPNSIIDLFKEISIQTKYNVTINPEIPLDKQNLKPKTLALLGLLYRQFLCDQDQRDAFDKKMKENDKKYQNALQEMYSTDIEEIFKQRKK